jgi:hypothetical protein
MLHFRRQRIGEQASLVCAPGTMSRQTSTHAGAVLTPDSAALWPPQGVEIVT